MSKTIIVSNRLPVKILLQEGKFSLTSSEGGLATGLGSVYKKDDNVWIGWPGLEISDENQQNEISNSLSEMNLKPVFLTQDEINQYYEGFSNEMLWPIFHYAPNYAKYEQVYWDQYRAVNEKFKDAVVEIAKPGDTIWIHDYQLLLLASMIRSELSQVSIGFFQHIPFPSFELFRLIPWRAELLEGMLGADLIGFHTFDDARHFIDASSRILPVMSSANEITYNDRTMVVEAFPMGIDSEKFESLTNNKTVKENIEDLRKSFGKRKVILSIDRLDYSKGILQRLQAFDLLLQLDPAYIENVTLYMIVVPSRDSVQQYKELRDEIDKYAGNINARYRTLNWNPIHYFYRSFPIETLSALYHVADICLVTPMRDGMNLVSKEYVASRTNNTGVLILSEMAGASKELSDALIVNPNNIGDMARTIIKALNMPLEEQEHRMALMRQVVSKFNIKHWMDIFMERLEEVKQMQRSRFAKHINADTKNIIENQYAKAAKRIIFLDYDGTLVGFHSEINLAFPDEDLYELLDHLSADANNRVVIVSGRNYETLQEWFGSMPIDFIAEHGAWQKHHNQEWTKIPTLNNQWKQEIKNVMDRYVDRTPGSFIEEKSYSLVWHYRKVEAGLGELRANELMNTLKLIIEDKGLQILPGSKVVEIKNIEVNKGKASLNWLGEQDYNFIMALGDDHTDEDIFKALPADAFTIKIGNNISAAKYYLRDFREVRRLLRGLSIRSSIMFD